MLYNTVTATYVQCLLAYDNENFVVICQVDVTEPYACKPVTYGN